VIPKTWWPAKVHPDLVYLEKIKGRQNLLNIKSFLLPADPKCLSQTPNLNDVICKQFTTTSTAEIGKF